MTPPSRGRSGGGHPHEWAGKTDDGERWVLQIEHDRFSMTEPHVVTLYTRNDDGRDVLIWATPEQAREMAEALRTYADMAEGANGGAP